MNFLEPKDISNIPDRFVRFRTNMVSKFVAYITQLNKLNRLYLDVYDGETGLLPFLDRLLDSLGITVEINEEDIKKIPVSGNFITVSNYPYGGLDAIILLRILHKLRPDFKVVTNNVLRNIEPLKEYFIGIDNMEDKTHPYSKEDIKRVKTVLKENTPLGLFPAGLVSSYHPEMNTVVDREWDISLIKMILEEKLPVIPVYFSGSNSVVYHLLGMIHPVLRTMKQPSEILNKKNRTIKVRIGRPIPVAMQNSFTDTGRFSKFLRAKTNLLGSSLEVKNFFCDKKNAGADAEDIVSKEEDINVLKKELEGIKDNYRLFTIKNYSVYCAPSFKIPKLLNEIGRLREVTFREVGEGTNRSIDLDEYDLYYHHLFIWDNENDRIVGAYRAGKGKEIIESYGIKGFYIHSLFKIRKNMLPVLYESIELGRSFIVTDYQRKPLPLFMLWKGILYFLIKNPEYRYLIGPVSISGNYSSTSKELIIKFIKKNFYNSNLAKYIVPRTKYEVDLSKESDIDDIVETSENDINFLDKMIEDIELENAHLPILLKKYISLNGRIIGFNVDPQFNMCLDGLLILDLFEVPLNTLESLSKEINDNTILQRFNIENI